MSRLLKIIKKYDRRASAHTPARDDGDITLQYEAIRTMYEYICIRDAIRYPGRVARPILKQWLDDNREEYTKAWERIFAKMEEHMMERYRRGYVNNLKIDFTPKVENPDPAQLERLKTMGGELADILRKFAEDALFTTEIRVDMPNKEEKE